MKSKKHTILFILLLIFALFLLTLLIALPIHFRNKSVKPNVPNSEPKEITKPVYLKAIYESLDQAPDLEKEVKIGDFKVGTKLDLANSAVQSELKKLTSENHLNVPDQAKSTATLKVLEVDVKQFITVYFSAKTYQITFDFSESGILEKSISDSLKQPLALKYTNKISPELKNALMSVKKLNTETHGFVLSHYVLENGETFDFEKTYNSDIKIKPVFTKTALQVEYTIMHLLEKQGETSDLDNTYTEIKTIKKQNAANTAVYEEYADLDKTIYEKDETNPNNLLSTKLTYGQTSVVLKQYYRLKTTKVNFIGNEFVDILGPKTKEIKQTRKVEYPGVKAKVGYDFLGWANSVSGSVQPKHLVGAIELNLYAQVSAQTRKITHIQKTQNTYGQFKISYYTTHQKVGSAHIVKYSNYNKQEYFEPVISRTEFIVSADETENTTTVVFKRRYYTVSFSVINSLKGPKPRGVYYGAPIGKIDTDTLYGNAIVKFYIENKEKTKEETENYAVYKPVRVEIVVSVSKELYPQTKVDLQPADIIRTVDEKQSFDFISDKKTYKFSFTRQKVHARHQGNYDIFEKYNGKYFRYEKVEFTQIPGKTGFYSKKIIDYSPFNLQKTDVFENSKYANSIFKGVVENIANILGTKLFPLTFVDNDPIFSVKEIAKQNAEQLRKESTDYAKEILMAELRQPMVFRNPFYRSVDITLFKPADVDSDRWMPYAHISNLGSWWTGTQQADIKIPKAYLIYRKDINNKMDWIYFPTTYVLGVVVGKK